MIVTWVTRSLGLLLISAASVASLACESQSPSAFSTADYGSFEEHFFDSYKTVVASADRDGYTPYWLGREFEVGGLTFSGPHVSDLPGSRIKGGGVEATYSAETPPRGGSRYGGSVILEIDLYSTAAWASPKWKAQVTKDVMVAGQVAKLYVLEGGTRPVGQLRLVLNFGETYVLAEADSGGAATPGGPDANPLIDEATFLAVMDNIRPYPQ